MESSKRFSFLFPINPSPWFLQFKQQVGASELVLDRGRRFNIPSRRIHPFINHWELAAMHVGGGRGAKEGGNDWCMILTVGSRNDGRQASLSPPTFHARDSSSDPLTGHGYPSFWTAGPTCVRTVNRFFRLRWNERWRKKLGWGPKAAAEQVSHWCFERSGGDWHVSTTMMSAVLVFW